MKLTLTFQIQVLIISLTVHSTLSVFPNALLPKLQDDTQTLLFPHQ